jgi:Fe2+ or Zn2+ uptake regulation protein
MANIDRKKYNKNIDSWIIFKSYSLRMTSSRLAIFRVFQKTDAAVSAEDIFSILKSSQKPVSRASIYRTLLMLDKIKFIQKSVVKNDTIYYEI